MAPSTEPSERSAHPGRAFEASKGEQLANNERVGFLRAKLLGPGNPARSQKAGRQDGRIDKRPAHRHRPLGQFLTQLWLRRRPTPRRTRAAGSGVRLPCLVIARSVRRRISTRKARARIKALGPFAVDLAKMVA